MVGIQGLGWRLKMDNGALIRREGRARPLGELQRFKHGELTFVVSWFTPWPEPSIRALEQFQQKWTPTLRPDLRENKELEHVK